MYQGIEGQERERCVTAEKNCTRWWEPRSLGRIKRHKICWPWWRQKTQNNYFPTYLGGAHKRLILPSPLPPLPPTPPPPSPPPPRRFGSQVLLFCVTFLSKPLTGAVETMVNVLVPPQGGGVAGSGHGTVTSVRRLPWSWRRPSTTARSGWRCLERERSASSTTAYGHRSDLSRGRGQHRCWRCCRRWGRSGTPWTRLSMPCRGHRHSMFLCRRWSTNCCRFSPPSFPSRLSKCPRFRRLPAALARFFPCHRRDIHQTTKAFEIVKLIFLRP